MAIGLPPNRRNISGSGFTNLQRILQASKANRLGQTVSSGIQQAGQAARGSLQQAGSQFQQQVGTEQQRQAQEQERANRVLGDVSKASEEDINAFEGIRGGQSKGPMDIANADELNQKAQEAERLGKSTGSETGRLGLLQRYVGGGRRYTGGQQSVDALLLGQTGADKLKQSRRGTFGLGQQAQKQQIGAQAMGKELSSGAKGLAERTIQGLGEGATKFDVDMEAKRVAEQANLGTRQDEIRKQLEAGEVEQNVYDSLGLGDNAQLYRTNLTDYYKPRQNIATKENVMGQEDFNKIQALRKLSGQSLTGDASKVLAQYSDPTQVGEFGKAGVFDFDKEALKDAINRESAAYHSVADPQEAEKAKWSGFLNNTMYNRDYSPLAKFKTDISKGVESLKRAISLSDKAQGGQVIIPPEDIFNKEFRYDSYANSPEQALRMYGFTLPPGMDDPYSSLKNLANKDLTKMNDREMVDFGKQLSSYALRTTPTATGNSEIINPYIYRPDTIDNWLGATEAAQANIDAMKKQYKFDRTLKRKPPVV